MTNSNNLLYIQILQNKIKKIFSGNWLKQKANFKKFKTCANCKTLVDPCTSSRKDSSIKRDEIFETNLFIDKHS